MLHMQSPNPYRNDALEINAKIRDVLLRLTEGFYAGKWRCDQYRHLNGETVIGCTDFSELIEAAKFAISKLNKQEGKNLKVVKLVRVNLMITNNGFWHYLTIEASDNNFYEAAVYSQYSKRSLDFIRPAVHYPLLNPLFLK